MRKLGIVGGGQLGRMAIEEARKYLAEIEVLSPDFPAPGADLADAVHLGGLEDREALLEFASEVEALGIEIERVDSAALRDIEEGGTPVFPAASVIALIQDKGLQKALWDRAGIPTARWTFLEPCLPEDAAAAFSSARGTLEARGAAGAGGLVWKARRGGYDGRGVAVVEGPEAFAALGEAFTTAPAILEERVDFVKELAVIVARSPSGDCAVYPCVEMVFDPRANLCDTVVAPAREPDGIRARAEETALACVRALDAAAREAGGRGAAVGASGVFGVELFLDREGGILVNEVAPRPHNSGHYTIEACASSQFDQYLRILAGYPLGSPELLRPACMVNLVGAPGATGLPDYRGLEEALSVPGVALHLYGKREVRPFRKMGHLTALGRDLEEAIARAEEAREAVRIEGLPGAAPRSAL